jgi:hypothetical protein
LNNREGLFLDTFADLEGKAANPDRYELIKASGSLRLLLLDAEPLVHQVNRDYRLKIQFTFRELPKTGQENVIAAWVRLPKGTNPRDESKTITAGLGTFLAAGCLAVNGRVLTVRDVILTNANLKGGVHLGRLGKEDAGEAGVLMADRVMVVGGAEASLAALCDIIQVTLEGLRPLVEAVQNTSTP